MRAILIRQNRFQIYKQQQISYSFTSQSNVALIDCKGNLKARYCLILPHYNVLKGD
jgi:hypothetical protein